MKHIIREIEPENAELQLYFDGDTFTGNAGNYCYNLFILSFDHGRVYGFNSDEYERIQSQATELADQFTDIKDGYITCSYKDIMKDCGIQFSPTVCHRLKEWADKYSPDDTDGIAAFLSITTGHKWTTTSATGYCQGDYAEIIYCPDFYPNGVDAEGDIFLGCAKEFSVTDYENADDTEGFTEYGYIVADCQARTDEDYKRIVCDYAGINPEDTTLEMIDGCSTHTVYSYRTV